MAVQPKVAKLIRFEYSARAWGTLNFANIFKQELAKIAPQLHLHKALVTGNQIADEPVTVMLNSIMEHNGLIRISAGIFFKGLLTGCSCSDDPSGPSESNEYCEVQVELDMATADAKVLLV